MATTTAPAYTPDGDITHMTNLGLKCNDPNSSEDGLFFYQRGLEKADGTVPILVLIHGYPETGFMWRQIIPLLPTNIPLFIPDVPGYGRSRALAVAHSKANQSRAIISLLSGLLSGSADPPEQPLILAGHDRGARICHHLSVHNDAREKLPILGTVLLDIVPTLVQFQTFSSPAASMGSFHWPFLATPHIAVPMILAFGGDNWINVCLDRWVGKSASGRARSREHGAWEVYAEAFKKAGVISATCDDYRAGAMEDAEQQQTDQSEGIKIDSDWEVLAVYSSDYLGKRYDVEKVWSAWMGTGKLESLGIAGVGHFIAEEAPELVAEAIAEFYKKYCK